MPFSHSFRMAYAKTGLLMDAAWNMVPLSTGTFDALSCTPKPLLHTSFAFLTIAMESPGVLCASIRPGRLFSKSAIRGSHGFGVAFEHPPKGQEEGWSGTPQKLPSEQKREHGPILSFL